MPGIYALLPLGRVPEDPLVMIQKFFRPRTLEPQAFSEVGHSDSTQSKRKQAGLSTWASTSARLIWHNPQETQKSCFVWEPLSGTRTSHKAELSSPGGPLNTRNNPKP